MTNKTISITNLITGEVESCEAIVIESAEQLEALFAGAMGESANDGVESLKSVE